MTELAALFRLGRELRYRPLPIIGQRVVIETLDGVEPALERLVAPWRTVRSAWDGCEIDLGLAKYGLLDRWCDASPALIDDPTTLRGVRALRANSFTKSEPVLDPETRATTARYLRALADDLGSCKLKLFLNDDLSDELRLRHNEPRLLACLMPELLPGYFPRTFTITDACITNAPLIWLDKHLYL